MKQKISYIEMMARKGGKASVVKMEIFKSALAEIGWTVEPTTAMRKIRHDVYDCINQLTALTTPQIVEKCIPYKQHNPLCPNWLRTVERHKKYGNGKPPTPPKTEFWGWASGCCHGAQLTFPTFEDATIAFNRLKEKVVDYSTFYGIKSEFCHRLERNVFRVILSELTLKVPAWKFTAPDGDTLVVSPTVNRYREGKDENGIPTGKEMKIARFFTWAYKKGLQEDAKKYDGKSLTQLKAERELAKRDLTNTGTCPCCFRNVKMLPNDQAISRHGWNAVGGGWRGEGAWHTSGCRGIDYPPFELSPAGTVEFMKFLAGQLGSLAIQKARLSARPSLTLRTENWRKKNAPFVVTIHSDARDWNLNAPTLRKWFYVYSPEGLQERYEKELQKRIKDVDHNMSLTHQALTDLSKMVAEWKKQELPENKACQVSDT
jgi:hypothetical protein